MCPLGYNKLIIRFSFPPVHFFNTFFLHFYKDKKQKLNLPSCPYFRKNLAIIIINLWWPYFINIFFESYSHSIDYGTLKNITQIYYIIKHLLIKLSLEGCKSDHKYLWNIKCLVGYCMFHFHIVYAS